MRFASALVLTLACTPSAVTPSSDTPPPEVAAREAPVRRLSDLQVHTRGPITFSDYETTPQRLAHITLSVPDDAVDADAGGVPVARRASVIAALRPGFRNCHNRGLQRDSTQQGNAIFRAKIPSRGGHPTVELVGGSGLDEAVVACMKRKLEGAEFESPDGMEATLDVPITFVQGTGGSPPPASIDFEALRVCFQTARGRGPVPPTAATFTVGDGRDGLLDVTVNPFEGDRDLLACAAAVVARIQRGTAPRPFAFRISFVD